MKEVKNVSEEVGKLSDWEQVLVEMSDEEYDTYMEMENEELSKRD